MSDLATELNALVDRVRDQKVSLNGLEQALGLVAIERLSRSRSTTLKGDASSSGGLEAFVEDLDKLAVASAARFVRMPDATENSTHADAGYFFVEVLAALALEVTNCTAKELESIFAREVEAWGLRPTGRRPATTVLSFANAKYGSKVSTKQRWRPTQPRGDSPEFTVAWQTTAWAAGPRGQFHSGTWWHPIRLLTPSSAASSSDVYDVWLQGVDPKALASLLNASSKWYVLPLGDDCGWQCEVGSRDLPLTVSGQANDVSYPFRWLNGPDFFLWEWLTFRLCSEMDRTPLPYALSQKDGSAKWDQLWPGASPEGRAWLVIDGLTPDIGTSLDAINAWYAAAVPALNSEPVAVSATAQLATLSPWYQLPNDAGGTVHNGYPAGSEYHLRDKELNAPIRADSLVASCGGSDGESHTEFRSRVATLLSSRGRPATARDWEALLLQIAPPTLLASVVAAESAHYDRRRALWGRGVDLLLVAAAADPRLPSRHPQRVPVDRIREGWRRVVGWAASSRAQLEMIRPLGVTIRLFVATPSPYRLSISQRAVFNIKEAREHLLKDLELPSAGSSARSGWAAFVEAEFRTELARTLGEPRNFVESFQQYLATSVPRLKGFRSWDAPLVSVEIDENSHLDVRWTDELADALQVHSWPVVQVTDVGFRDDPAR